MTADALCGVCGGSGQMWFEWSLICCDECGGCGHYRDPEWPVHDDDGWWFECPACVEAGLTPA